MAQREARQLAPARHRAVPRRDDPVPLKGGYRLDRGWVDAVNATRLRAAGAVLNPSLSSLRPSPIIIVKTQRVAYLTALNKVDGGDFAPLGGLIGRATLDNLNRFIVPSIAGAARLGR